MLIFGCRSSSSRYSPLPWQGLFDEDKMIAIPDSEDVRSSSIAFNLTNLILTEFHFSDIFHFPPFTNSMLILRYVPFLTLM